MKVRKKKVQSKSKARSIRLKKAKQARRRLKRQGGVVTLL